MAILTDVQLLKQRRTKIVATVGPASSSPARVEALIQSGVDVFRLNMSHGTHQDHATNLARIRQCAEKARRPIAVLGDLCGPKIRVGEFTGGGIDIAPGDVVVVTTRQVPGEVGLIPCQYKGLTGDVEPGSRILIADGLMELRVETINGSEVQCTVIQGGHVTNRKGINLPNVAVSAASLTDKDKEDAAFILGEGVDFLALSFVRRRSDLEELRDLMDTLGRSAALVAKIERPEALEGIDGILDVADAIMVARGDLGVELPPEQVPALQQQLLDRARQRNRPVIVATQMLESMVTHPRPTRAEVTDVSHSVAMGADALMLSAESATGDYPIEAVEMMDRIARQAEAHLWRQEAFGTLIMEPTGETIAFGDAVARATSLLSRDLKVRAVIVFSESGMSAITTSAARPAAPIIAISSDAATCRKLALNWGALPVEVNAEDLGDKPSLARDVAVQMGIAASGDYVLAVQGFHQDLRRSKPSIMLLAI
ncbi:MAG: pyruvate kinase [Chromatiales bacterium]|nr:pyruvate kinase [Chromatiales bacterium]